MSIVNILRQQDSVPALKHGVIGLDINNDYITLCQLKRENNSRYQIIAKSIIKLPMSRKALLDSPADFRSIVSRAMKGQPFKGKRVATLMPPDQVKTILLSYKSTVKDVDAEIINMLSQRIDDDIDDYIIDYLPVRNYQADEERIVMAIMTRRSHVESFLSMLEYARLQPYSLEVGPTALRRFVSTLHIDHNASNILLINSGEDKCYLTIISRRRLLLDQAVNFGCYSLVENISKTLDLPIDTARELFIKHGVDSNRAASMQQNTYSSSDLANAIDEIVKPAFLSLIDEINRVLVITASETHGNPLSHVYLFGCLARVPGINKLLQSLLGIPIEQEYTDFHETFMIESSEQHDFIEQIPELAKSIGLALRDMDDNE